MLSLSLTLILFLFLAQVLFCSGVTYGNMSMNVSSPRLYNKANIFLGLIEYELSSLLSASHLVDYIHI